MPQETQTNQYENQDNFESEIDVPETDDTLYKKEGILIDKNAEEYKFTLWDDQTKGIAIGTQIQLSNAYYSYDLHLVRSLNITSKNDIKIISG